MKIVDRYVLREYLLNVIYCLSAFCMIYLVCDLFGNLSRFLDAETPLILVLRYYLFFLGPKMELLAPASLLLATLYTLWQFARHNELTAMRASGVSIYRIMIPFLAVGLFFSVSIAILKETVLPEAERWSYNFAKTRFRQEEERIVTDYPYLNNNTHSQWHINKFDLENPGRLRGVEISQEREDGTRVRKVTATKAEWLDKQWWFHNAEIQLFTESDEIDGKKKFYPLIELTSITEEPTDLVDTRNQEYLSAIEIVRYLKKNPTLQKDVVAKKRVDLHLRMAMPWACLIITLFGIPIGSISGRQNALTGIFIAIALLLGFYTVLQFGIVMGKTQKLFPWLAAWLSNIIFAGVGTFMTAKVR